MILLESNWNIEDQTIEILVLNTDTEKYSKHIYDPKRSESVNVLINTLGEDIKRLQE